MAPELDWSRIVNTVNPEIDDDDGEEFTVLVAGIINHYAEDPEAAAIAILQVVQDALRRPEVEESLGVALVYEAARYHDRHGVDT